MTDSERVEYRVGRKHGPGKETRTQMVERRALPWSAAVESLLESYEADKETNIRLAKGSEWSPDYTEFTVSLENSWMPAAQERAFAELKGLERETVGFYKCDSSDCGYYCEEPDEHGTRWVAGEFEEPCLGLVTLTASAVPGGKHLPPVDHTDARRDTWGGRDGVRRKLNDVMTRKLGLDASAWTYWRQCEPHPGEGDNACYGHDHMLVIFDRAETDGSPPLGQVEQLLRSVVDRHVERCEYAGPEAHGTDAVEVKSVVGDGDGEIGNLANYLADYLSVDPDTDLLERPIEFVAWAAAVWAADRNKRSRSVSAGDAIDADACRQRYRDSETEQNHGHGERLSRNDGRGPDVVCAECESGWGVPDAETVTEARLTGSESKADDGAESPSGDLRSRWPSAQAAATVGMTPRKRDVREQVLEYLDRHSAATVPEVMGALGLSPSDRETVEDALAGVDPPEVIGFDDPPDWRADAVIRDGEEHSVSGGGVELVPLKLPNVGGRLLWERPSGARFRCSVCNFSTYNPATMKYHAARHDAPPEETVRHDFVSAGVDPPSTREQADSAGSLSQRERVDAVMSAVDGGATVEEIVASVDAPEEDVRHTVERLNHQGRIFEAVDGQLRETR